MNNDWNGLSRCLCREGRRYAAWSGNDCDAAPYQFGCQFWQLLIFKVRPAIIDCHIPALKEAGFAKTIAEFHYEFCVGFWQTRVEKPNHRQRTLLRTRREWPSARAGKRRQQFPSCNVHMPLPCEGAETTVARLGRAVSETAA